MPKERKDKIGCVGKLPVQADMLHYNLKTKNTKLLESWLQEGFIHTTRDRIIRNQAHGNFGLNYGLLLNYGVGRNPIVGYLSDSTDSFGRHFPMLLFEELIHPDIAKIIHLIPMIYRKSYQDFYSLLKHDWSNKSSEQFIDELKQLHTNYLLTDPQHLLTLHSKKFATINYKSLLHNIIGEFSPAKPDKLLQVFVAIVKSIGSQGTWQLNLPIAKSKKAAISICFWLTMLKSLQALNYRNLHLAWRLVDDDNTLNLTIHHGSLSIAFFRSLVNNADARIRQINLMDYLVKNEQSLNIKYQVDSDMSLQEVFDYLHDIKSK